MKKPQMRVNVSQHKEPPVDAETLRLSNEQLEHLGLVGIHMGPAQRRALAAAARVRLAEEGLQHD